MPAVSVHGILLLDKPLGISSNSALQKAKRLFNAKKAGHTGSLDPLATGMLPICFGEATKFAQFFINDDKAYTVEACLGIQTSSGDSEGEQINKLCVPTITQQFIEQVLLDFMGHQQQIPPMFSAVKIDGKRLYKLARKGKEIERPARDIYIKKLELSGYDADTHTLKLKVVCSKGTYIRTLVEDIAKGLGTCGHVTLLHRDYVGLFEATACVSLEQLSTWFDNDQSQRMTECLLPVQTALPAWPKVALDAEQTLHFKQGRNILKQGLEPQEWIQVYSDLNEFVGLGRVKESSLLKPKRLLCTKSIEIPRVSQ